MRHDVEFPGEEEEERGTDSRMGRPPVLCTNADMTKNLIYVEVFSYLSSSLSIVTLPVNNSPIEKWG